MYEFDAVSVSTYEAASLAAKLTEKSADGWEVVAIVPAGSDITAYLKKTSSDAGASSDAAAPAAAAAATGAATSTWGSNSTGTGDAGSSWGTSTPAATDTSGGWGSGAAPAAAAAAAPTAPAQPATPSVPAGWYHDPAGRFELRYWDGSAWTDHVSRAGQQYTDPPVA